MPDISWPPGLAPKTEEIPIHQRIPPRSRDAIRPSCARYPSKREQGMPGGSAAPTAPCARVKKHMSLVTTGWPKRSGIPCAMALRLIPRSLRRSGFFVTVPCAMPKHCRELTPASRRQDHAASSSAGKAHFVLCAILRPSHPAPNVPDDAQRPSWRARDDRINASDLPDVTSEWPAAD